VKAEQGRHEKVTTQEPRRVVVFTGRPATDSTVESLEALSEAFPQWQFMVCQGSPSRHPDWKYFRSKLRRLVREPLSYPLELGGSVLGRLRLYRGRVLGKGPHLPTLEGLHYPNVKHHCFYDIHSESAVAVVKAFRPWLGVSIGSPILKPFLFTIPEIGTINVHKSLLPNYRGMPPGFWELHDGASQTGVSIHRVAEGLDTGDILLQEPLSISERHTYGGLRAELDSLAIQLLIEALSNLDSNRAAAIPQGHSHTGTNRAPPYLLLHRVHRRLVRRRLPDAVRGVWGTLRSALKETVLLVYVHLWAPIRNLWRAMRGRCHTTVILYHRVNDRFIDPISIGYEQFNNQIELLKRYYDVFDMPTFLASQGTPRRRPSVVITFDDGYEDNYRAAALLRRKGLPATFFLCTAIVGTDNAFPHDVQRLGRRIPALSWAQVKRMRKWGFHFGNHTRSHANLAKATLEEAQTEIEEAREDLLREVGQTSGHRWLAYPHGKPTDLPDEIRSHPEAYGVDYCFSAYGGVNLPDWTPTNILRQGIDHSFTLLAFRATIEGWRVRN